MILALAATLDCHTPERVVPPLGYWVYLWTISITPNPVLLFNYSAATLNSHRIHYDRPYAMQREGYPGLVVHGPLSATLLLQLLIENVPEAVVTDFSYTAVSPLFDTSGFRICGRVDGHTATLWAVDNNDTLSLTAKAELFR